jgi:hypothetical protein
MPGLQMPFDISRLTVADTLLCSTQLRIAIEPEGSVVAVARQAFSFLADAFRDARGERAIKLARMYVTHPYARLAPEDQLFARNLLNSPVARWPFLKCLTLLATRGAQDEWNDRTASRGHRAIPLPTTAILEQAPMIAQLFLQMGVELSAVLKPETALIADLTKRTYNVFHVPKALGSAYIPAQDEFVRRHGVESVIGFGGALPWGEHFAVVLFSRVPIGAASATRFKSFALDIKARLLKSAIEDVFDSAQPVAPLPARPAPETPFETEPAQPSVTPTQRTNAFRQFRDAGGVEWNVWAVAASAPNLLRSRSDRWQGGWLLFESSKESRRLSPIPENWDAARDRELEALCAQARRGPSSPRAR